MEILKQLSDGYNFLCESTDPRLKGWPLLDSPVKPCLILLAYFLFVYYGPKWMERRKPMELRRTLIAFNFFMGSFNLYLVLEALPGWLYEYTLGCQPVDYSNKPAALRAARYSWYFLISKFAELIDTVFFILLKKNDKVTFAHVFHHGSLPALWWWGVKQVPGGFGTFHGLVNCSFHVIMYFYNGFMLIRPRYRKNRFMKNIITFLQLGQFFVISIHNSQFLFMKCSYPWQYVAAIQTFTTIIAALFLNVFYKEYKESLKNAAAKKNSQNGSAVKNGAVMDNTVDGVETETRRRNGYLNELKQE